MTRYEIDTRSAIYHVEEQQLEEENEGNLEHRYYGIDYVPFTRLQGVQLSPQVQDHEEA